MKTWMLIPREVAREIQDDVASQSDLMSLGVPR